MTTLSFPEFTYVSDCELYRVLQFAFSTSYIDEKDGNECTTLHYACTYTDPVSVRMNLEVGSNPNAVDALGDTPLTKLLMRCNPENLTQVRECCALLLKYGANPNVCAEGAMSPLMIATYLGCPILVMDLLAFGANVNYRLESSLLFPARSSALTLAIARNDPQMLITLLQCGSCDSFTRFHALQKTTNPIYKTLLTKV
jgi:ankyrin repeat protein